MPRTLMDMPSLRCLQSVPLYNAYVPRYSQETQNFFLAPEALWTTQAENGGAHMSDETAIDEDKSVSLGVQVIARAASVLRALEGSPEGLSLAQIAREVGLARSTVQRIVAALATEDFVTEAQPGRGVRIGPGLARKAASISSK